jgi:hypothetical protein
MCPHVGHFLLLGRVHLHVFFLVVFTDHQPVVNLSAWFYEKRTEFLYLLEDVGSRDPFAHTNDGALIVPSKRTEIRLVFVELRFD